MGVKTNNIQSKTDKKKELNIEGLVKENAFGGREILCPFCKEPHAFVEYLDRPEGYLQGYGCTGCSTNFSQHSVDVDIYNRIVYKKSCSCGFQLVVLTQADDSPEYYTGIGVVCPQCGDVVNFELPVN